MKRKFKVFLGGTTAKDNWRQELIPMLDTNIVEYMDPVVSDWNEEAQQKEIEFKKNSDINLYVITPAMEGVFSIAEVVDDSNKRPDQTIFCILTRPALEPLNKIFTPGQLKSLEAVKNMVDKNGAIICDNLVDVANTINTFAENLNEMS